MLSKSSKKNKKGSSTKVSSPKIHKTHQFSFSHSLSLGAQSLLRGMLENDPENRFSIQEVVGSPWIQGYLNELNINLKCSLNKTKNHGEISVGSNKSRTELKASLTLKECEVFQSCKIEGSVMDCTPKNCLKSKHKKLPKLHLKLRHGNTMMESEVIASQKYRDGPFTMSPRKHRKGEKTIKHEHNHDHQHTHHHHHHLSKSPKHRGKHHHHHRHHEKKEKRGGKSLESHNGNKKNKGFWSKVIGILGCDSTQ